MCLEIRKFTQLNDQWNENVLFIKVEVKKKKENSENSFDVLNQKACLQTKVFNFCDFLNEKLTLRKKLIDYLPKTMEN